MPDRPAVSVCMPAHRDTALFREALASVLAQPVDDLEVIVSDDSGGGLEAAVLEAADPRIRYVANPRPLGFVANHTTTLDLARGALLAILHDDDRWLPTYLPRALAVFAGDPLLGMACADAWLEWAPGQRRRRARRPPAGRHARWLALVMDHNTFIPSGTVMRRELWEEVRHVPWPDLVIGDIVLWIEAARTDWAMTWIDDPQFVYRMHAGQVSARQELHRAAGVEIFSSYDFAAEDPEAERLRRSRVAHYLLGLAGLRLRGGDARGARADLAAARRAAPARQRARRLALSALAAQPWLLPLARNAWRRVRRRSAVLDG